MLARLRPCTDYSFAYPYPLPCVSAVFYLFLFKKSGWPLITPSDPDQQLLSVCKGWVYSTFEFAVVVGVVPAASVADYKVLAPFSPYLAHLLLS